MTRAGASEMPKLRFTFCLLVTAVVLAVDVVAVYGCSYEGIIIGWAWVGLGVVLQVAGIGGFILSLIGPIRQREGIICADYLKYGVFGSKWYYAVMIAIIGCMIFAYAVNRYGERGGFELGKKWWTCPRR